MATIELQLYTTNKRVNSDEVPKDYKFVFQALVKENTSILSPTFVIDLEILNPQTKAALNSKLDLNYCFCPDFGRYYWIDDIKFETQRVVYIFCHVDVLATYSKWINKHKLFIKYSSDKSKWNKILDDDRLSADFPMGGLETQLLSNDVLSKYFGITSSASGYNILNGTFLLTAPYWYTDAGAVYTWAISPTNINSLLNKLSSYLAQDFSQTGLAALTDLLSVAYQKLGGMGEVSSYVQKLIWVPFNYSAYTESENNIKIAAYDMNIKGKIISEIKCWQESGVTSILYPNVVPSVADLDKPYFLRRSKYSSILVKHPCGFIDIPADAFVEDADAKIAWSISFGATTGDYICSLYSRITGSIVGTFSGNLSLNYMYKVTDGSSGAAIGGATLNAMKSAVSTAASLMGSMSMSSRQIAPTVPVPEVTGTNLAIGGRGYSTQLAARDQAIAANTAANAANAKASSLRAADITGAITNAHIGSSPVGPVHGGGALGNGPTALNNAVYRYAGDVAALDLTALFSVRIDSVIPIIMDDVNAAGDLSEQYQEYATMYGYPIYKTYTIEQLSPGFVQAAGPIGSVEFTDTTRCHPTDEEIARIAAHVNNGYYKSSAAVSS